MTIDTVNVHDLTTSTISFVLFDAEEALERTSDALWSEREADPKGSGRV